MSDWAVSASSVVKAGQAIFEHRKASAREDAKYRVPMIYRDYKWDDLPAVQKVYHCDLAMRAFISLDLRCEAPVFEESAYTS